MSSKMASINLAVDWAKQVHASLQHEVEICRGMEPLAGGVLYCISPQLLYDIDQAMRDLLYAAKYLGHGTLENKQYAEWRKAQGYDRD